MPTISNPNLLIRLKPSFTTILLRFLHHHRHSLSSLSSPHVASRRSRSFIPVSARNLSTSSSAVSSAQSPFDNGGGAGRSVVQKIDVNPPKGPTRDFPPEEMRRLRTWLFNNFRESGSSFHARRRFTTTILTPDSGGVDIPSDLLSKNVVPVQERTIGLYQDLVIPVTNFHHEDKGLMVLAGDVFDVPIRKDIIHRVVRWQLAKRQQGTHSTKTISEVSGTGRKPWPQKGTGRARHGTLRGPQFRGGAVMHGPKPRSHAIKLQKKVRRLGLKIALTARAAEGKLLVFEDLEVPTHKTKNIVNYVKEMENAKKLLVVDGGPINEKLKLATQNIHYVNVLPSIGLNVYSILLHDTLVMSRDAVNRIVERMHTPINR